MQQWEEIIPSVKWLAANLESVILVFSLVTLSKFWDDTLK
jgi:hypothetical protein